MKNPSFYICASILVFAPLIAYGASTYESENVAAGVIATAGNGATYDMTLRRAFSVSPSSDSFGRDMYDIVYERVRHQGSDLAISRTLAPRNLSQEELNTIIPGLDITNLLTKTPMQELNPAEPLARRDDLMSQLADEKFLADLEVGMRMEVESVELFANGDESDSGFDLIVDLDNIERLLFGEQELGMGGSDSASGGTGGSGALGGPSLPGRGVEPPPAGRPETPTGRFSIGLGRRSPTETPGAEIPDSTPVCASNQSFNDAVNTARDQERAASEGRPAPSDDGASPPPVGGSGREGASPTFGAPRSFADRLRDAFLLNNLNFCVGSDGESRSFCLKVEAVYKRLSSYALSDNCIACHLEKINDAFKKTLDHSLVPSKATGNLMEASKCKKGIGTLKWNVVLLPQPILTPPNDDLLMQADFMKNIYNFCKAVANGEVVNGGVSYDRCDWLYGRDSAVADASPQIGSEDEKIAKNALNNLPAASNPADIIAQINKEIADKQRENEDVLKELKLAKEAGNQAMQYKALLQEMDTMNTYFQGYVKLFNDLIGNDADAPCQILRSKPSCDNL